jgi:hypothetical protein
MPSRSRSETTDTLSATVVSGLAAWRGNPVVTTIYLDVDGRRLPRRSDLKAHVDLLFRVARDQAARLGPPVVAAVEGDLDHVERWLADMDRTALRGVALFSCGQDALFRVVGLSTPVRDQVAVAPTPALAQLCEALDRGARALVALVDRRELRLVRLEQGRVDEHAGLVDEPPRQVDTDVELGSFGRLHEEEARRHLRRSADAVSDELARWPAERIVLGGPVEAVSWLEEALAPSVSALAVGRITLPMRCAPAEVALAAWKVIEVFDEQRRSALVEDLRQRAERGVGGAAGLPATLDALGARRVETLLVARGFAAPGRRCPRCEWLVQDAGATPCPGCGTATDVLDDVVEAAIGAAVGQDADVEVCDGAEIEALGNIGAVERF